MSKINKFVDSLKELFFWYFCAVFVSALLFSFAESKPFVDALWWAFVTAMTVGYGDMYPVTLVGRLVAVFLMHIVPIMVVPLLTARISSKLIVDSDKFSHDEQENIKESLKRIEELAGCGILKPGQTIKKKKTLMDPTVPEYSEVVYANNKVFGIGTLAGVRWFKMTEFDSYFEM